MEITKASDTEITISETRVIETTESVKDIKDRRDSLVSSLSKLTEDFNRVKAGIETAIADADLKLAEAAKLGVIEEVVETEE